MTYLSALPFLRFVANFPVHLLCDLFIDEQPIAFARSTSASFVSVYKIVLIVADMLHSGPFVCPVNYICQTSLFMQQNFAPMKFVFFALATLYTCSAFSFNNVDTLIVKSVARADSLRGAGQADKALDVLRQTRQQRAFKNASCASQSLLFHKMGVCHYMMDHYREALSYWRDTSLQIRLTCLGKYHKETANSYYAVAMAYRYLGDLRNEGKNVRQALDVLESLPEKDPATLAYNYLQAAYLFFNLEDQAQALNYFEQSERLYKSLPDPEKANTKYLAEVKKLKGLAKSKLGRSAEGARDILAAVELFKQIEKSEQPLNLAQCYQNLSIVYAEAGDFANAEKYGQMALKINQTLAHPTETSKNYESLGRIKKQQHQYAQALNYFQQSLELRKAEKQQKLVANAYENIADVYLAQQDYAKALENYQLAVDYLVPGQQKRNGLPAIIQHQSVVDRTSLLRVIGLQARCWRLQFDQNQQQATLEKAYAFYRTYDTLHIQIRQQFKETGSKYWLMQMATPVYEEAIGTALQLHQLTGKPAYQEEAYLFSARSKAAVLLEGLQDLDAKLNGIPADVFEKEQSVREHYVQLEKLFFESLQLGDQQRLDSLRTELFKARREYDKLTEELESRYPGYFQLKYAFPGATSVAALRKKMPGDAIMLEYFVGRQFIYIFKITKAGIESFEMAKPADFEKNCVAFRKLSDGSMTFTPEQYAVVANALFEVLLEKPLQGLDAKIERLMIIPDNLLLQLSFDVLPYMRVDAPALPYLIKKYAVSIAYSNQLVFDSKARARSLRRRVETYGGFGLEYDNFTLEGFKALHIAGDSVLKKRSAGKLPNSDDEVAEIAALLHGDAWINQQATKDAFFEHAPNYRILHLAMHGMIDEDNPLNSALIFSREKTSEDFILRAAEVYGLSLQADMAVLSACNTGHGDLTPEGIRSLARAFTYAGCPSLIGSLWYAYDGPTREILVTFYKYLKAGKPKDVALRLAKLDYLQHAPPTYTLPEYWSNLVMIGDPGVLEFKSAGMPWLTVLGSMALAGLLFGAYRKYGARKLA